MEIDASYCYLPDNTWFVDGLYHGMTFNEDYTRELAIRLLLTDELTDVFTDPAFPQFRASANMANGSSLSISIPCQSPDALPSRCVFASFHFITSICILD